jgi:hypothetical protein
MLIGCGVKFTSFTLFIADPLGEVPDVGARVAALALPMLEI